MLPITLCFRSTPNLFSASWQKSVSVLFLHLLLPSVVRANKQNLLYLKLSDYMCLFPELYIAVCTLRHTKRHGQALNMLTLFATHSCCGLFPIVDVSRFLFKHTCYLLDQSLSLISFISSSKLNKIHSFDISLLAFLT